jgi:hypothetical protein
MKARSVSTVEEYLDKLPEDRRDVVAKVRKGAYAKPGQADALKDAFAKAGKKLDMGKSCLRFKKVEDLPLDAIGKDHRGHPA